MAEHSDARQEPGGIRPVLTAFLEQAARSPEATALIVGGTALTYRELDHASAGLARLLAGHGAAPGKVVCIRLEPSALAVVAVLATLRTGAAWSALEPDLPRTRLEALYRDTDCVVVLSREREPIPQTASAPPKLLDAAGLELSALIAAGAEHTDRPIPAIPGETAAYLIYTSGSTGPPKGVMVSRDQLAASVGGRGEVYGDQPSVYLMAMRLSFDGMLGGMFWSFSHGHVLLLPDARELVRVQEFARLAREHRATHLIVVPSYYRALLEEPGTLPDSLRLVVVAGEVCTPELVATHRERLPHTRLVNEYGPTETTISCTVEVEPDAAWERIPIGRPWPGVKPYVLDDRLRRVRPGELGELYVGGPFVGMGYASRPGKTAERFVADPFGRPGSRLYRTGDLVSVDERGALHYHGRRDHQIKIRGARIELGEIESVLERHPGLGQAVVVCQRSEDGAEPLLTAFLLPATPGRPLPDARSLRRHCLTHLVEQAVPAAFVPVERIPLNSSGKADRSALREMVPAGPSVAAAPVAGDWSGYRKAVGAIWAEVLRHSDSGPEDNFFAVGGSSLRVIDLHNRMEKQWPGALRVGELFDLITIAAQADTLAERLAGRPGHPVYGEPDGSDRAGGGDRGGDGPAPLPVYEL